MHRHGYKGRKFHRETDQRQALIAGLAEALVEYETIETTLPKAKELVPFFEKLITKAKKGDLHNRRQVLSSLRTVRNAHKLVDEIAPKLQGRTSGHLRIERTRLRRGDNAQLARVSFVDELNTAPVAQSATTAKPAPAAKAESKAKPAEPTRQTAAKAKEKN